MELAKKLELHYYFSDRSHSMDANVRNKCEQEVLAIIQDTAHTLGIDIKIDAEAYTEGGLKEVWKVLGENNAQIALIVSVAALILSQVPNYDPENDELQKELTTLSIEEKKLNIEKLKKELEIYGPKPSSVDDVVGIVNSSYRVLVRKSNFYKFLSNYKKVTKVGVGELDAIGRFVNEEAIVQRDNFERFILSGDKLPPEMVDEAVIEIIAPVLKEGNYKWKGLFEEKAIGFTMNDFDFKNAVLNNNISFQHGSTILCVLKIYKKLDEVGEVVITSYSVEKVLEKSDGGEFIETEQGKKHRFTKKQRESQQTMFDY